MQASAAVLMVVALGGCSAIVDSELQEHAELSPYSFATGGSPAPSTQRPSVGGMGCAGGGAMACMQPVGAMMGGVMAPSMAGTGATSTGGTVAAPPPAPTQLDAGVPDPDGADDAGLDDEDAGQD